MHQRYVLFGVDLLEIAGHLHADGAAADDDDPVCALDGFLVLLEVGDRRGLVVAWHGARGREAGACGGDEVVEGKLARSLPFAVEEDLSGLEGDDACSDDLVA